MPSYDDCLVDAELKARADYAAPGRYYHDERHLDDCLWRLDQVHDLAEAERRLLRWAILWHDSIYEPTRTDNEELSAERAFRELTGCGVAEEVAGEVARGRLSGQRKALPVGRGARFFRPRLLTR